MGFVLEASIEEFRYWRQPQPAISSIDFRVSKGEFVVLTGPSGAGKTTLCYCLAGVIPHFVGGIYRGVVRMAGQSLADLRLPEIAALVGLVLERPENQLFNLTVEEDVAFGPENLCKDPDEIRHRLLSSLALVGMQDFTKRASDSLSGGETQRVVLSSVLATDPDLFILDRPAAELDPLGRKQVYESIARLNREAGKTILLIEDRLSDVLPLASRVLLMTEGRIVKDASPEEFFDDEDVLTHGLRIPDGIKLHHLLKRRSLAPERVLLTPGRLADHLKPLMDMTKLDLARAPISSAGTNGAGKHDDRRSGPPVVEARALSFRYPRSDRWALKEISLAFQRGELTAIIGANGAGKTTLAKHFAGLLRPTRGQVFVNGQDSRGTATARLSDTVGYLFQDPDYQIFCDSVFDEVAFSLKIRRMPSNQIAELVENALHKIGLLDVRESHPYRLSRGQRQRLALASALVHRPRVLVVDEPSTGLDDQETVQVMDLLTEFREEGGTVLMITHDMELVVRYAKRTIVMAGGSVLLDTATAELAASADVLTQAAIQIPDLHQLAQALGLPSAYSRVEEVARLIVKSCT
ncbi:MAG: ABC transporter ATP-binding protein [Chloroflexi bacterium]|nr:ABC transporter ATP-binding protein [Chloroflexota bacterium]